jgi:hypothetical protein
MDFAGLHRQGEAIEDDAVLMGELDVEIFDFEHF